MNIEQKIGNVIVSMRRKNGLTQQELAIRTGISRRYLADIEKGRRHFSIMMVERIARELGTDIIDILVLSRKTAEE